MTVVVHTTRNYLEQSYSFQVVLAKKQSVNLVKECWIGMRDWEHLHEWRNFEFEGAPVGNWCGSIPTQIHWKARQPVSFLLRRSKGWLPSTV